MQYGIRRKQDVGQTLSPPRDHGRSVLEWRIRAVDAAAAVSSSSLTHQGEGELLQPRWLRSENDGLLDLRTAKARAWMPAGGCPPAAPGISVNPSKHDAVRRRPGPPIRDSDKRTSDQAEKKTHSTPYDIGR